MKRVTALLVLSIATALLSVAAVAPPASALSSTGDGTWFWRSPQPEGNWLNAVCASGDSLWAVGYGGTILHSADNGVTWATQSSGTSLALNGVSFPDPLDGWAVGGNDLTNSTTANIVLHTTDGGLTWNSQQMPGHSELWAVDFVDALTGWVSGDDGTVLHTTNGGLTWLKQTTDSWESLTSASFSDANHGVVGGPVGSVLETTDGGAQWRHLPLGSWGSRGEVIKPVFADATHGWALLMDPDEWIDNGSGRVIIATSDGGAHWRPLATPRDLEFTAIAVDHGGNLSAAATDDASGADLFINSADGGLHWSRQYADVMLAQAMAADGDGLCAVGDGLLSRTDGGPWLVRSSWSVPLQQVQMFDDSHGVGLMPGWFSSGDRVAFARTTDGVNWDVAGELPFGLSAHLAFPDAQHGWAVGTDDTGGDSGTGRIYATSDGGLTWQRQGANMTQTTLTGVSFADAEHGWVCGLDLAAPELKGVPLMLATTDGGQSWSKEKLPAGFLWPAAVDFISPQDGWAVGAWNHGRVSVQTTDGGVHWTESSTGFHNVVLQSVSFIDSLHGWATGKVQVGSGPLQPAVLATTDGGQTWARQSVPGAVDHYNGVAFVDPSHGWLFSGDPGGDFTGSVWQTTDGGTIWTPEDSGVGGGFLCASVDGSAAYAAGVDGFLSTVDRGGDSAPPATYDDFDGHYHRSDVTIHLEAADIGGGTVATTQYRIDRDPTWHTYSGAIVIPALADHSNDGLHRLYYRSIDSYGNVEPSGWWLTVPIDTLGPTTLAGPPATVARGGIMHLPYRIDEKTSPRAVVVIHILSASGRSIKTLVRNSPVNHLERLSGRCGLRPGRYRYVVYARDLAGNPQVHAGWGRLIVKAHLSGATVSGSLRDDEPRWTPSSWLTTGRWRTIRACLDLASQASSLARHRGTVLSEQWWSTPGY